MSKAKVTFPPFSALSYDRRYEIKSHLLYLRHYYKEDPDTDYARLTDEQKDELEEYCYPEEVPDALLEPIYNANPKIIL